MTSTNKKLTVIVPVYNEELALERFIYEFSPVVKKLSERQECHVLFVNNGSNDGSVNILRKAKSHFESYGILTLTRNFGYETALIAGLTHASGDFFAFVDADGEDPVELLIAFQDSILTGKHIAIGIRKNRFESSLTRYFRKFSYQILSNLSDDPFRRNAGNFSMFSAVVRDAILFENNSFPFLRSTLSRTGYEIEEFPHDRNPRIDGKSKYRKISLMKFAIAGFMTATTWPLRFISYASVINLGAFFIYLVESLISETGLAMNSFYIFFLLLTACQAILFLGVIALYLARVYKNSLGRPLFYVDWAKSDSYGNLVFGNK
jgi:dolichol-phosphate mannosyltransferase